MSKLLNRMGMILFPICIVQIFITIAILNLFAIVTWYNNSEIYQNMDGWIYNYVDLTIKYGMFLVMAFLVGVVVFYYSKKGSQKFQKVEDK